MQKKNDKNIKSTILDEIEGVQISFNHIFTPPIGF